MAPAQVELILTSGCFVLRHALEAALAASTGATVVVLRRAPGGGARSVVLGAAGGLALGVTVAAMVDAGMAPRDPTDGATGAVASLASLALLGALLSQRGLRCSSVATALVMMPRVVELALAGRRALDVVRVIDTDLLLRLASAALALALAAGVGGLLVLEARLHPRLGRAVAGVVLLVLLSKDLVAVARVVFALGLVRTSPAALRILAPFLNAPDAFLYALVVPIAAVQMVLLARSVRSFRVPATPVERRVSLAGRRLERRLATALLAGVAATAATASGAARAEASQQAARALTPAATIVATDGQVGIPAALLRDGKLHRFAFAATDGTIVRFIAIHKGSAQYGVALDACEICGPSGYVQLPDGQVLCRACNVALSVPTIGQVGGCNPIPLPHAVRPGMIQVPASDLEAAASGFH